MKQEKKKGTKKLSNKTIQILRKITQLIFIGILVAGFYYDIRVVIMVFLPISLFFGNFFCGWACPFGTVQELMGRLGRKIFKKRLKMPRSVQKYLQFLRYILFVIVMIGIADFVLAPLNGYTAFMGIFMEDLTSIAITVEIIIMLVYLVASLLFERVFCNYLCTESVPRSVLSMARIFSIKRNEETCVNCKKCDTICPMNIEVSMHDQVRNGQCINCMECINVCPVEGTLTYGKVKWPIKRNKEQ